MTSAQFSVGDLIRRKRGRYTWRVVEVTHEGYLHAKCDDRPGVTRVVLRVAEYEKVENRSGEQ